MSASLRAKALKMQVGNRSAGLFSKSTSLWLQYMSNENGNMAGLSEIRFNKINTYFGII